jgi:hypothetical protein
MPPTLPKTSPADDPLGPSRLEALREAVAAGLQAAAAGRLVDGRVVEHELRDELTTRLERQAQRKGARRGA